MAAMWRPIFNPTSNPTSIPCLCPAAKASSRPTLGEGLRGGLAAGSAKGCDDVDSAKGTCNQPSSSRELRVKSGDEGLGAGLGDRLGEGCPVQLEPRDGWSRLQRRQSTGPPAGIGMQHRPQRRYGGGLGVKSGDEGLGCLEPIGRGLRDRLTIPRPVAGSESR